MTAQSCRTCEYFDQREPPPYEDGFCTWCDRNPFPACHARWESLTDADGGCDCPCWLPKGCFDDFLAAARARRTQETP